MPSQIVNLVIDQGASYSTVIELEDDNGNPLILTGYTGNSEIRHHYSSTNASASFTVNVIANTGQVTLGLTANATANLYGPARYVYDVFLTDPDGIVTRVVEGQITVTPSVTHA